LLEDAAADAKAVTRDYFLELDKEGAPLLNIFGGKITTFRKLAEDAVDLLCKTLDKPEKGWTEKACLPGGDLFGAVPQNRSVQEFCSWAAAVQVKYSWLPQELVKRYVRAYGTRVHTLLEGCASLADMGEEILPGVYAAEVNYLRRKEWAVTAADILWRRSKLGLHLPAGAEARLDAWLAAN
jgi:glycerol-3-phosphate dehydrogenase